MGRPKTGSFNFINGSWHVRNTVGDGERRTFDLGTDSLSEAKRLNKRLLERLKAGMPITELAEVAAGADKFREYAKTVNERRKARGVESARDEWQRLRDYAFPLIGNMRIPDIRPRHINDVLESAVAEGLSQTTIRHLRKAMSKVFRAAVVDEIVTENVVEAVDAPKVSRAKKERVQLTDEEMRQLVEHLTAIVAEEDAKARAETAPTWMRNTRTRAAAEKWAPHVRACAASGMDHVAYARANGLRSDVLLLWIRRAKDYRAREQARVYGRRSPASELRVVSVCARTIGGQRTGDVIRADWVHFDVPAFTRCIVVNSKAKKPRRVGIHPRVRPYIRDWWRRSGCPTSGPAFPVLRGARVGQRRPSRGHSYAGRLRAACRAAGLTRPELYQETDYTLPVDFHSYRRAFATAGRRAGIPPERAMALSGHSSRDMHELYVGSDPAFEAVPDAMVPDLPELPEAPAMGELALPEAPDTAAGCGSTEDIQQETGRATVDSNHWPSAPEGEESVSDEPPSTGDDAGSWDDAEPPRVTAGQHGSGFRLFLPRSGRQLADLNRVVRPRVPAARSEMAGGRLEAALAIALNDGPVEEREADVLQLLSQAAEDLGLVAVGGAR